MKALYLAAFFALASGPLLAAPSSEYPSPLVREEQTVIVDGVTEVWQLKWAAKPKPICEPSEESLPCPCAGFAYGEGGILNLIRTRSGVELDHLALTPLFEEGEGPANDALAVVQRWPADYDTDFDLSKRQDFPAIVAKRPITQVMHFADYDHDGRANEFYLQTGAGPCGHTGGVVIGVSKRNPRLHAFGTASKPDKPLHMGEHAWQVLRNASGPIDVLAWACGDHASDTQTTLRLRWTPAGIDGSRRTFSCTPDDKPGILTGEDPL